MGGIKFEFKVDTGKLKAFAQAGIEPDPTLMEIGKQYVERMRARAIARFRGEGPVHTRSGGLEEKWNRAKGKVWLTGKRVTASMPKFRKILDKGGTIRAKRVQGPAPEGRRLRRASGQYMTFMINGRWVKVKQVKIAPKRYARFVRDDVQEIAPEIAKKAMVDTLNGILGHA